ncbi:hypothetical protein [Streptosporangium sp. NPDC048865]|uniref:hypothetical protein n=1 Tax=Streptosporangium sp. NPDC048865 TaxID=3155766 RepID=UPI00342A5410
MTTIGVDFDVPLHAYSRGWVDGTIYDEPTPGGFDALRQLMADHAVFIFTARDIYQTALWLQDHGFDVEFNAAGSDGVGPKFWNKRGILLVTNRKLPAVAYIDDRGIRWTSWPQALADLETALHGENPLDVEERKLKVLAAAEEQLQVARDRERLKELETELAAAKFEIRHLRAGEIDQPAPEGMAPTPEQWIHWWNRATPDERISMVNQIFTNAATAATCFEMNHRWSLERLGRLANALRILDRVPDIDARTMFITEAHQRLGLTASFEAVLIAASARVLPADTTPPTPAPSRPAAGEA